MQQQAGLGVAEAGWLAAINYAGYLSGALIASLISDLVLRTASIASAWWWRFSAPR